MLESLLGFFLTIIVVIISDVTTFSCFTFLFLFLYPVFKVHAISGSASQHPRKSVVGSNGLEPSTSRLSGARSNHLSYEPISVAFPVAIQPPVRGFALSG